MRIDSISASFGSTRNAAAPARALKTRTDTAAVPQTEASAAPVSKGRAHGVIKKLGTGHYSDRVEAKLTARFAPHLLTPPASAPIADPATDPATDPALNPQQPIPAGETPTDLEALPDTDIAPDSSIIDVRPDESKPDGTLSPDAISAFANFNVLDFTQSARIDLIA